MKPVLFTFVSFSIGADWQRGEVQAGARPGRGLSLADFERGDASRRA